MKKLATMMALLVAIGAAADYLVRVDLTPGYDIRAVASAGADVLNEFDGWCLVRVSDANAARLAERFAVTVLDQNPGAGQYVYAEPDPRLDRKRLAAFGLVLTEDRTGVLLRTTRDGVRGLNRLPVELCGVSTHPLVLDGPAAQTVHRAPQTAGAVSDSLIWELMARASQDSAEAVLRRLIAFHTRYSLTESCWVASNWFQSKLAEYGCDTTHLDTFMIPYEELSVNVVGVKRGRVNPNRIYIVGGHIDDASEIPFDYAPGSDDNASGAGLVLEAARMFAGIEFDYTVWFVGFGAEEFGLVGSDTMARECRARGDSIALVINHDMDSYGPAGRDSIRVVGKRSNPPCSTWVDFYMAQADTFTDLKCHMEIVDEQSSSDQASFWKYGYTAIRDRYLDRDPVYHTTGDTIGPFQYVMCGTNNIPMYTEAIKATVATIAKLAGAHQHVGIEERKPAAYGLRLTAAPTVFRTQTTIRVFGSSFIAHRSSLSIYDASGRLVRALPLPQPLTPSPYSLPWNGATESGARAVPGVYYARVCPGSGAATVRLVLAR